MDSLIQDLQKTILAVEKLSGSTASASDQLDELLDQLFQQKIDLVNASLNVTSGVYLQAAWAMKDAAGKAELAVQDPAKLVEMEKAIAGAINKLSRLLDHVSSIE